MVGFELDQLFGLPAGMTLVLIALGVTFLVVVFLRSAGMFEGD